MAEFLEDVWSVYGDDLGELKRQIERLDKSTVVYRTLRQDVRLLSVNKSAMKKEDDAIPLLLHKGDNELTPAARTAISKEKIFKSGHPESLVDEAVYKTGSMLSLKGKYCLYLSRDSFRDIGARCGLAGDSIYTPSITRDAYLTHLLHKDVDGFVNLVIKCDGSAKKVFAMPSGGYQHIKQKILLDILDQLSDELGKVRCVSWYIDHSITRIFVEFPEKAADIARVYKRTDIPIPGMLLETSDTGDSSVVCTATWSRHGRSPMFGENYARKHTGKITVTDIMDGVQNTVFKSYTKLPERLCELALIDVSNPGEVIDKVLSTTLRKVIGKRRVNALSTAMKSELYTETKYTAMDIAMMFIDGFIERCVFKGGGSEVAMETLQKALYQVPFAPFEEWADLEEPTVELLPA